MNVDPVIGFGDLRQRGSAKSELSGVNYADSYSGRKTRYLREVSCNQGEATDCTFADVSAQSGTVDINHQRIRNRLGPFVVSSELEAQFDAQRFRYRYVNVRDCERFKISLLCV
ncbi:MAG TPA: hypothetical protein VJN89_06800 [Candidatus Acidoferrum sp.]|nr:hypothetical protein [Candidatus Acidoferrum sp.]